MWRAFLINDIRKLRKALGLPPVSQIGVVVKDVEKAVGFYESIFGLGPFEVYEFVPENHWFMEVPSPLKLKMGKAAWGEIELELIQPLEGRSLHKNFLEAHGEGLQHLGFDVPNYDEMFDNFIRAGFQPLMRAETNYAVYGGYLKACYFDTHRIGGIIFEILHRTWKMAT